MKKYLAKAEFESVLGCSCLLRPQLPQQNLRAKIRKIYEIEKGVKDTLVDEAPQLVDEEQVQMDL